MIVFHPGDLIRDLIPHIGKPRRIVDSLIRLIHYFNVEIPVGRVGAGSEKRAISMDFVESCT